MLKSLPQRAKFRDPLRTLDNFDFSFNKKKVSVAWVFVQATGTFITRHEDAFYYVRPETAKF